MAWCKVYVLKNTSAMFWLLWTTSYGVLRNINWKLNFRFFMLAVVNTGYLNIYWEASHCNTSSAQAFYPISKIKAVWMCNTLASTGPSVKGLTCKLTNSNASESCVDSRQFIIRVLGMWVGVLLAHSSRLGYWFKLKIEPSRCQVPKCAAQKIRMGKQGNGSMNRRFTNWLPVAELREGLAPQKR